MRTPLLLLAMLTGLSVAETSGAADSTWKMISDDDGIVVYQRRIDGLETISLRGETTIDAPPKIVAEVMADNRTAQEWIPMVVTRRTLKEFSPVHRIEYTHINMPWPLTDRYFVNIGKGELLADGSIRMFIKSYEKPEELVPAEPEKVLGILHYSEFMLTSLEGGNKTHVRIEVNTDPRGMLPAWVVNTAQRSWPRNFFTGLLGQMRKRGLIHDKLGPAPGSLAH